MLKVIFLGNQLFDFMFVRLQRVIVDGLLRSIFSLPFPHKTQRQGAKHDANIWRKKRIDSLTGSGYSIGRVRINELVGTYWEIVVTVERK